MSARKFMLPDLGVLFVIEDVSRKTECSARNCTCTTKQRLRYICHDVDERSEVIVPLCEMHTDELESWYQAARTA